MDGSVHNVMNNKNKTLLTSVLVGVSFPTLFIFSCGPAIKPERLPPAENISSKTTVSEKDLKERRRHYLQQCAGCHRHILPGEQSPRQWKNTLNNHSGRPLITKGEYEKLKNYVLLASELTYQKQNP